MPDPFAGALNALFAARAIPATYVPEVGPLAPLMVIHHAGDVVDRSSGTPIVQGSNVFEIRSSDLPEAPAAGDTIIIPAGDYKLYGEPLLDPEGVTWFCGAEPA